MRRFVNKTMELNVCSTTANYYIVQLAPRKKESDNAQHFIRRFLIILLNDHLIFEVNYDCRSLKDPSNCRIQEPDQTF
jgi:hypothetical protein